jgi:RNA polymerase sigma-70 factor (ECF subfamily)
LEKEKKFEEIVYQFKDKIESICKYYCQNPDDRKDIFQEILINIWNGLDRFKGKSTINTWVYRITVNTSLSFVSKSYYKKRKRLDNDIPEINTNNHTDSENWKITNLEIEINALPVIDRTLISLSVEGISIKEISEIVGISESNVKVKIHRIKKQLQQKLKDYKDE